MTQDSTTDILGLLPTWDRFFSHYEVPTILNSRDAVLELKMRLINLRRRLRDGPQAPLRVAFFGPTGSGKSKLFSSLIGQNLSSSGFRRPFTRKAVYYVHEYWRGISATLVGEVEFHEDATWQDALLIDTPDFDSVEVANRVEAERVFLEADAFLFVTDSLKYADASTWEYLAHIRNSHKNYCTILNKVNSPAITESFHDRFKSTFGSSEFPPLVVMPELQLRDDQLIASNHPAIEQLRIEAKKLSADAGPQTSARMFQQEANGILENAELLQRRTQDIGQQFSELLERGEQRLAESKKRLDRKLSAGIGPEVREEVYQKVLKRLDRIDVLRYPRKLLTLPIRGLKALVTSWLPGSSSKDQGEAVDATDPVTSETFHLLESEIIRLADESRVDVTGQPGMEHLLDRETFQTLRMTHEEVKTRFAQHYEEFRDWLAQHARDTASEITGEHKAKFILSQVLFNTLIITAQVHTGGALSLFELGVDGLISPFVARAVGMAIGSDRVKEFEEQAHQHHQRSLGKILEEATLRFQEFLANSSGSLEPLTLRLEEILKQRSAFQQLIGEFQQQAKSH